MCMVPASRGWRVSGVESSSEDRQGRPLVAGSRAPPEKGRAVTGELRGGGGVGVVRVHTLVWLVVLRRGDESGNLPCSGACQTEAGSRVGESESWVC